MKATIAFLAAFLLSFASACLAADSVGNVKRTETTPEELRDLSITFERLSFSFPEAVQGRFWIEAEKNGKLVKKQDIPSDAVPASTSFALGYVHTADHSVFVSVTTTHDGRADRRTGSYGAGVNGGKRTVSYKPASDQVPLGVPFELFSAEVKPGWRYEKDPTWRFRIMAQFTAPQ